MTDLNVADSKIVKYKFEVPIKRAAKDVWSLLTQNIDAWWMKDFRALGEGSTVSLQPEVGGLLLETSSEGIDLEWYRVQMCIPGKALYLVGYMAPDWGGPTVSMLKLGVDARDQGSVLTVSDALMGNVTEAAGQSAASGWEKLFGEGFQTYAHATA